MHARCAPCTVHGCALHLHNSKDQLLLQGTAASSSSRGAGEHAFGAAIGALGGCSPLGLLRQEETSFGPLISRVHGKQAEPAFCHEKNG